MARWEVWPRTQRRRKYTSDKYWEEMMKLKNDNCSKETTFGYEDDVVIKNGWVFSTVVQLS